jgi:hypothetical protein
MLPFFYPVTVEVTATEYAENRTSKATRERAEKKIERLTHASRTDGEKQPSNQQSSDRTGIAILRQWYQETLTLLYSHLPRP